MKNQTSTKEMKVRPNEKTAESALNSMKQNQNKKWCSRHFVPGSLEKVASAVHASRE